MANIIDPWGEKQNCKASPPGKAAEELIEVEISFMIVSLGLR
jgi:hypothetical protein